MSDDVLAPRQRRSRETLTRLLNATIAVLDEHDLAGATIPRIAQAAGVAPASVYRRFKDRDALFRAAFVTALEQSAQANRKSLRIESFKKHTLEGVVGELLAAIIKQYRTHPGVLRALVRFTETDSDERFRARALEIVAGNAKAIVDLLMTFRSQIAHRNARRAITFALLNAVTAIEEIALERISMWHELLHLSDGELQKELSRTVLAYLLYRRD